MIPRMYLVEPQFLQRGQREKRNEWPAIFSDDLDTLNDNDLLQRGRYVAKYILKKCETTPKSMVLTTFDKLSIVSTYVIPGTMNEVLEVFSRDKELGFQAFLLRVFQDSLLEARSIRRANPAPEVTTMRRQHSQHDQIEPKDKSISFGGCTAAIKQLKLEEKWLFKTVKHELTVLDFVQKLSDKSFVRAFKSIDAPPPVDSKLHRLTNLMFGYHMSEIEPGRVHVSFYGQHVGKKSYAQTILHELSRSVGLLATAVWRRRLARHISTPKSNLQPSINCHLCQETMTIKNQTICKLCNHSICIDCSKIERAESTHRVAFDLRVCDVCLAQCQANLSLTNKPETKRRKTTVHDESQSLPRISEHLSEGQTRHAGVTISPCKSDNVPALRRRVHSQASTPTFGFATPKSATGNYVAVPQVGKNAACVVAPTGLSHIFISAHAETLRQNAFSNGSLRTKLEALCTSLAAGLDCSHSYVSLIYRGGFSLKATTGTPRLTRIPRLCAFNEATLSCGVEPLMVPDASADMRFNDSPRVDGSTEAIRFYVGITLITADGVELGTVAVADPAPRVRFSASHGNLLKWYASTIVDEVERRCR